jgi:triosephosphate isomerase (TIM)
MSRKLFIAGNWKMNKTAAEAVETVKGLVAAVAGIDNVDISVFPTNLSVLAAKEAAEGSNVTVGVQNVHFAENGAYTAEVSTEMLKEHGITQAIIGHSERRQYFNETDETVNKRTLAALAAGITPITCIGETMEERQSGSTEKVLDRQLRGGLVNLTAAQMEATVLAYEPVWAIGTGLTASPAEAQDAHAFIRKTVAELFGSETAEKVIIQYGGSVKAANVAELVGQTDIDGALVGGASLKVEDFSALLKNASAVC